MSDNEDCNEIYILYSPENRDVLSYKRSSSIKFFNIIYRIVSRFKILVFDPPPSPSANYQQEICSKFNPLRSII